MLFRSEAEEGRKFSACRTKDLRISGGDFGGSENFDKFIASTTNQGINVGFTEEEARHLAEFYGTNAKSVFDLAASNKIEAENCGLPKLVFAKLIYGIQQEMVATPLDFYFRRTGDLLFDIASVERTKGAVLAYMAGVFNWTPAETEKQTADLNRELLHATEPGTE